MALIHVNFFSEALGMCVACDVILPQRATKQIGMAAASRVWRRRAAGSWRTVSECRSATM